PAAAEEARANASGCRGNSDPAELAGRDDGPSVVEPVQGQPRSAKGGEDPRRGPLRARAGEGADSRVARGPQTDGEAERLDSVFGGAAGGGKDIARTICGEGP